MAEVISNVTSNDFFARYNNLDLTYAKGLAGHISVEDKERFVRAIDKARKESISLFDAGEYESLKVMMQSLALRSRDNSRVKVVGMTGAKDMAVDPLKQPQSVMNEQVVNKAMNKQESMEGPSLTLGRNVQ